MISEIFLHVGLHKTATTSIQNTLFLKENSKLLEDNNYLYPKRLGPNHSIPMYSIFSDDPEKFNVIKRKGRNIPKIKKIDQRFLNKLNREIEEKRCTKLIISGEGISLLTKENLSNLRNYFLSTYGNQIKFNIVIYVRNPITWAVSAIQGNVKHGSTKKSGLTYVLNTTKNRFQDRIEKFSQVFGSKTIKIHKFEEATQHEFGPVGYFLNLLNLNKDDISRFHYTSSNESMSMLGANFLSYANKKLPLMKDGKLQENRRKSDVRPVLNIRGPKFDIPHSEKITIFENSQDDVNWLRKNFGINYSLPKPSGNSRDFEFTEEIISDLKNTFKNLSSSLKPLFKEFLQQQCDNSENEKNKKTLLKLLNELEN